VRFRFWAPGAVRALAARGRPVRNPLLPPRPFQCNRFRYIALSCRPRLRDGPRGGARRWLAQRARRQTQLKTGKEGLPKNALGLTYCDAFGVEIVYPRRRRSSLCSRSEAGCSRSVILVG